MIHVTPLYRLPEALAASCAHRLLVILSPDAHFDRPREIAANNLLRLSFHDITEDLDGLVAPSREAVAQILAFAAVRPDERLAIACYAGISRSTAAAYIIAAARNPIGDEARLANQLRHLSPSATPNIRMIAMADAILDRQGRMVAAIQAIGRGAEAFAGTPFSIPNMKKAGREARPGVKV